MAVEELTSFEQLQSIEPAWMDLWKRDPSATPFQSPQWVLPWIRHFGAGEILTVAVRENGRLDAIAPFFILRDDHDPSESLGMLLGSGNSDYVDMLRSPDAPIDAVIDRLAAAD